MLGADPYERDVSRDAIGPATMHRLRSLLSERNRNAWDIGDLLVAMYGPPTGAQTSTGIGARLDALGDALGVSGTWLARCRNTAAAWPERHRRLSLAWTVSVHLAPHADRIALLDAFVTDCARARVTPSLQRLVAFLDQRAVHPIRGRRHPRDPVSTCLRACLALDPADLARLVAKLQEALATPVAA